MMMPHRLSRMYTRLDRQTRQCRIDFCDGMEADESLVFARGDTL